MKKKLWMALITALALLAISGCQDSGMASSAQISEVPEGATIGEEGTQPLDVPNETPGGFSLTEVSRHSTGDDCWLAIDGRVYDVSAFVAGHPGGEAILQGCGTDATELYRTRPMGSGTAHSPKAVSMLDDYFIGMLDG